MDNRGQGLSEGPTGCASFRFGLISSGNLLEPLPFLHPERVNLFRVKLPQKLVSVRLRSIYRGLELVAR